MASGAVALSFGWSQDDVAVDAGPKGTSRELFDGRSKPAPPAERPRPLPAFYYRLPALAQRCYLKSDSIDRFALTPSPAALAMVAALMETLEVGAPSIVQRAAQILLNELCRLLGVRPVRVEVRSVRPRNARGELHGLFYPRAPVRSTAARPSGEPLIVLWMRTAQRHDVVKPRTFLRTLMHELGQLDDSYHTGGFFKRESFLVRTLLPGDAPRPKSA
jgi:hypothetical protein